MYGVINVTEILGTASAQIDSKCLENGKLKAEVGYKTFLSVKRPGGWYGDKYSDEVESSGVPLNTQGTEGQSGCFGAIGANSTNNTVSLLFLLVTLLGAAIIRRK